MADTKLRRQARTATRELQHGVSRELADLRGDLGVSQRSVARAAGLDSGFYSRLERGRVNPSLRTLVAAATALGADVSVRLYPNAGPRIHDRVQAPMIEAVLGVLHPRWLPRLEVPVYRPARGVIDLVLLDLVDPVAVASEAHGDLRRLEQQVRRATEKAESLPSASGWPFGPVPGAAVRTSRLLLLRSARATRELVRAYPETFAVAYPASTMAAYASLTGDSPWPGSAVVWVDVRGRASRVLEGPPRGVPVGR